LATWLLIASGAVSPLPLLAGAIAINLLAVFLHVASDAQKHSVLKLQPWLIWDGCWPLPQHQLSGRSADLPLLRHHGYALAAQSPGHSNALGALFKTLVNPGEANVQQWLRQLTANPSLVLMGRYGTPSYIENGSLFGPAGVLVGYRELPRSRNLVSAADMVRLLTLVGWHHQLGPDQRLAGAQWTSLRTVVEGLGHDSARYIDAALENLGLVDAVASPVIISKLGYGAETADPEIDALTYAAFAQFNDLRSGQPRQRSFALALRIPTSPGAGVRHDARMAAEVIEIVRRVFAEEWG
jgi:hypothetical protein